MPNPKGATQNVRRIVLTAIFLEVGVFYALENSGLYRSQGYGTIAVALIAIVLNNLFLFPYLRALRSS